MNLVFCSVTILVFLDGSLKKIKHGLLGISSTISRSMIFRSGTTGDHMFTHTYAVETDDFAGADASKPDTWVFERVKVCTGTV